MRDALGGTVNIVIIVVFIVFALGYMAFNVNYTKAFRMKDKIVSVYEKYNGTCTSACQTEISTYSKKIGYNPDTIICGDAKAMTIEGKTLFCVDSTQVGNIDDMNPRCYYHISTKININIPLLENIYAMSRNGDKSKPAKLNVFYVNGDTKTVEKKDGENC